MDTPFKPVLPNHCSANKRGECQGSVPSMVDVHLDHFSGGIGFWGAVPASYDTTRLPIDRGIHVHARNVLGKVKYIDKTYNAVRILSNRLPDNGIMVSEREAIYYMVSTAFGFSPQNVICPTCSTPHLDEDWFCVHPHFNHICENCGKNFYSDTAVVCNPIATIRERCGIPQQQITYSNKELKVKQADFPNGILIWGSNPAFLWTGHHAEQEGMHVHVFGSSGDAPELDETYGIVRIDEIDVSPNMVRLLMAQNSVPSLHGRVAAISCLKCGCAQFDIGESAFTPTELRHCTECGQLIPTETAVISNPVLDTFRKLEASAPRAPQRYTLDLPLNQPR